MNVGIDEVARGCLYGRVYAAAVVWNPHLEDVYDNDENIINNLKYVKDSKKLSRKKRDEIANFIEEYAIDYSVAYVENDVIDKINILQATQKAMHLALDKINVDYDKILVDGNYFKPYKNKNYECIIKGDNKVKDIAAASILAKVYHDKYILELEDDIYDLHNNMGYGTKKHIEAIKIYGPSKFHRKSFLKKIIYNNSSFH